MAVTPPLSNIVLYELPCTLRQDKGQDTEIGVGKGLCTADVSYIQKQRGTTEELNSMKAETIVLHC